VVGSASSIADVSGDLRLGDRLVPAGERDLRARSKLRAVEQKPDDRRGEIALGLHGWRAKPNLPADLLGAAVEQLLAQRHLRTHAIGDARVLERFAHECPPGGFS
jgi:hypothetical protein